jgi:hypothetical protein
MTKAQVEKCRGEGFITIPRIVSERFEAPGKIRVWTACFCGSTDHYATFIRLTNDPWRAAPIHCYVTGRMAWVDLSDVAPSVLRAEEDHFRALMGRYEGGNPITAKRAVELWSSEGVPLALLEDDVTDIQNLQPLVEAHLATGKQGQVSNLIYS